MLRTIRNTFLSNDTGKAEEKMWLIAEGQRFAKPTLWAGSILPDGYQPVLVTSTSREHPESQASPRENYFLLTPQENNLCGNCTSREWKTTSHVKYAHMLSQTKTQSKIAQTSSTTSLQMRAKEGRQRPSRYDSTHRAPQEDQVQAGKTSQYHCQHRSILSTTFPSGN